VWKKKKACNEKKGHNLKQSPILLFACGIGEVVRDTYQGQSGIHNNPAENLLRTG
jgi:hypothetical protein